MYKLAENQKAIDDLNIVIEPEPPHAAVACPVSSIAHAPLGPTERFLANLAKTQQAAIADFQKLLTLPLMVAAAELGEKTDQATGSLELALKEQP